jgi:GTP diphosphokinase / guanosine-3',5'-bis(diphosphate) 3'-diphosphatase
VSIQLQDLLSEIQSYQSNPDLDSVRKAHSFMMRQHKGQTRASGEPYVTHLLEVAFLAAKLRLDIPSIITALLHDTIEDTEVTIQQLQEEFSKEVAQLVDGVTKLSLVKFSSREEAQAENFRKMLLAMAKDIRVILVKLCDRTHNMRTLEFLSESRRKRIAQETLDIYAPLAHRLGIYWLKSELEDHCLHQLKPDDYEDIKQKVNNTKTERELYIKEVVRFISQELEQNGVKGSVSGRPKHFFSIHQKMEQSKLMFDEIYDLIAFRVIVDSTKDCYAALGVVHSAWKPIPGRFKDYIAMPKPNNYQSLHTSVVGPRGHRIEIQIRSEEMHEIAERGIAAHWIYKEENKSGKPQQQPLELPWLKDLIESEKLLHDPIEFISTVKEDLFTQEVFVFSPKGDLIALSKNATPIDFAYHIHTQVGQHCVSARINGRQVPLSHKLQNGDTVEIVTSDTQSPSKDWLNIVATTKAKQRIRAWLKNEERIQSIETGKDLLSKDLRKLKISPTKTFKNDSMLKIAHELGYSDLDLLFAEIGYGKLATRVVVARIAPELVNLDEKLKEEESALQKIFKKAAKALNQSSSIKIHGMGDMVFRFAKCCEPLPGEELVGYITRGRGVAVHSKGCSQTLSFDSNRIVPVTWDSDAKVSRPIRFRLDLEDKVGVLAGITQTITNMGLNFINLQVNPTSHGRSVCTFEVSIEHTSQIDSILRKLEAIKGVVLAENQKRA